MSWCTHSKVSFLLRHGVTETGRTLLPGGHISGTDGPQSVVMWDQRLHRRRSESTHCNRQNQGELSVHSHQWGWFRDILDFVHDLVDIDTVVVSELFVVAVPALPGRHLKNIN